MSVMAGKVGLFKTAEQVGRMRRTVSEPNLNSRTGPHDNATPFDAAKASLIAGAVTVASQPGGYSGRVRP